MNKILTGVFLFSVAAYADATLSYDCLPGPIIFFPNGVGGPTPVYCPAFTIPGYTLTSIALKYVADYQSGGASNDVVVTFVPAGPDGVTWTPASQQLNVTGGPSSSSAAVGGANPTAGFSPAAFATQFIVNVSSSVVSGAVADSSIHVSAAYTFSTNPPLSLACPAVTTGSVGTPPFSWALVAAGGDPPYQQFSIATGSLPPALMLNAATGAITGTLTTAGTFTFTAQVRDARQDETASTNPAAPCTITISNTCNASFPIFSPGGSSDVFQIRYAANLDKGDSFVDLTNTGAQGNTSGGNICANVYTFDPAEELISCCACQITPNGLQSLSVLHSLINSPLTPAIPTSVVIKLVASVPNSEALASGMLAWGTTLHATPSTPVSYELTEGPFSQATLSSAELSHITSTCGFIQANGSGFGICAGCAAGGLGSSTSNQ